MDTITKCGTCYWGLKEFEKTDKDGNVIDVVGTCQFPLPFFIVRSVGTSGEVSLINDGGDCPTWKPTKN